MELEITDLEPIDIKLDTSSSTNFGGGIELLMNDKNKSSTKTTNIDLGDLDKLEEDLNDLSNIKINSAPSPSLGVTFDDFSKPGPMNVEKINVQLEAGDSKVGSNTMGAVGNTSTWDGFMKTSETPHSYDKPIVSLNERDKKRKKRQMLKKN